METLFISHCDGTIKQKFYHCGCFLQNKCDCKLLEKSQTHFNERFEDVNLSHLREQVAAVLQNFSLFYGTLLQNIVCGGQAQKVMLARALIRQSKILILDEATRMLDNQTENVVMKNIEKMQLTRIVVSHRQNAIKHADRILKMSDGALCQLQ